MATTRTKSSTEQWAVTPKRSLNPTAIVLTVLAAAVVAAIAYHARMGAVSPLACKG